MSRYPWETISPYQNFAATDASGAQWAFPTPPVVCATADIWIAGKGSINQEWAPEPIGYGESFADCPDWRDSLESRPVTLLAGIEADIHAHNAGTRPTAKEEAAPGGVGEAYPTGSDREVLLYLMQQFDGESLDCPCGRSHPTADFDSADYLRRYLAATPSPPTPSDVPESVPRDWTGIDGAIAFHLIERHAESWDDAGRMMDAWRKANPTAAPAVEPVAWAQSLIEQLPSDHDGRNSWLLNHGIGEESDFLRSEHKRYSQAWQDWRQGQPQPTQRKYAGPVAAPSGPEVSEADLEAAIRAFWRGYNAGPHGGRGFNPARRAGCTAAGVRAVIEYARRHP